MLSPQVLILIQFILKFNEEEINLFPEVQQLFKNAPLDGTQIVENLMITKKVGGFELKIIFDSLLRNSSPKKKDEYMINSESIIILIK